ncbi:MAG: HAD hydrolase-like protein, partial [Geminicoccaceae bacterium]|nr:HAD hydrolase-like protein [Geminicoccaceae bacterium]
GKPHRPIYAACLDHLEGLEPHEILCIGDSLEHDIAGAGGMDMDAALVAGGIHAEELLTENGRRIEEAPLEALMAEHCARPRYVLPRFVW